MTNHIHADQKDSNVTPTIAKVCPKCADVTLVGRVIYKTGRYFLGCPNAPACTYTEDLPTDLEPQMSLTLEG